MNCQKCKETSVEVNCSECMIKCCPKCAIHDHIDKHIEKVSITCQECEQNTAVKYCQNCEEHLCQECSIKIHNKAKRAKHTLIEITEDIFRIRQCYLLCADVIIGREAYLEEMLSQITGKNKVYPCEILVLLELDSLPICKKYTLSSFKSADINTEMLQGISNLYPFIVRMNIVESISSAKLHQKISNENPLGEVRPVQIPQFYFDSIDSFGNSNSINMSTSTENSMRKRAKKSPIPYYQPWLTSKNDKRRPLEEKYREIASKGILMSRKEGSKDCDEYVTRQFSRNIGENDIDYISMQIDNISVECLCWVIRSIKLDKMTPSQKLILSRLKESFEFKVSTKLWQQILKYFQSNLYTQEMMEKDTKIVLPQIIVQGQGEQNLLLFQNQHWEYEDQGKTDQHSTEWRQFVDMLQEYFNNHSQIGGGRYGCVQYVKLKSSKPLQECSLGKLSLFVQEAINRGIIRYHKTLLVSNNDSQSFINNQSIEIDSQLMQLQRDLKIMTLQLTLVEMFLDCGKGTQISLAQIPLNLKKNVCFEVNLIELGFPKLKNLLSTLNDKLALETTKSHVSYDTLSNTGEVLKEQRMNLQQMRNMLLAGVIEHIIAVMGFFNNIVIDELYSQLNIRLGFLFDFKIFNAADFYQFLLYYCNHLMDVQFISGVFLVFQRTIPNMHSNYGNSYSPNRVHPIQLQNPESLTPKFNSSADYDFKELPKVGGINWGSFEPDVDNQGADNEEGDSYLDERSIYNIIDDNSENTSQPKTVIQKNSIGNNQIFETNLTSIHAKSAIDGKSFCELDSQMTSEMASDLNQVKSPRSHTRVYSTTPLEPKKEHTRVASTLSPTSKNN